MIRIGTPTPTEPGKFARGLRAFDTWLRALMATSRENEIDAWIEEMGQLYDARDQIDARLDILKARIGRSK